MHISFHSFSLIVKCPRGTFSESGLEPCSPCPVGQYQPDIGKKDCLSCGSTLSTHGVGAQQKAECACKFKLFLEKFHIPVRIKIIFPFHLTLEHYVHVIPCTSAGLVQSIHVNALVK